MGGADQVPLPGRQNRPGSQSSSMGTWAQRLIKACDAAVARTTKGRLLDAPGAGLKRAPSPHPSARWMRRSRVRGQMPARTLGRMHADQRRRRFATDPPDAPRSSPPTTPPAFLRHLEIVGGVADHQARVSHATSSSISSWGIAGWASKNLVGAAGGMEIGPNPENPAPVQARCDSCRSRHRQIALSYRSAISSTVPSKGSTRDRSTKILTVTLNHPADNPPPRAPGTAQAQSVL